MGFNGVEWDLILWDLMGLNHQIIFGTNPWHGL
jgi:hypothetical protein